MTHRCVILIKIAKKNMAGNFDVLLTGYPAVGKGFNTLFLPGKKLPA
jgi:hypothetical protein